MPKPVQLKSGPSKEELLARVTVPARGPTAAPAKQKTVLPTPPPARPLPPGVTGNPPLPTNKVVGVIPPSSLTAAERESLEALGWTDDIPIPDDFAKAFDSVLAERVAEAVVPPVDPATHTPLKVETIPLEQADPATRDRLRKVMTEMVSDRQAELEEAAEARRQELQGAKIPGLANARRAADKAASAESQEPVIEVTDKHGPPPSDRPSSTGADARPTHCQHCSWDLSQPDVIEPAHADKLAFLQCLLGDKPYVHEYELFGGAVVVTFRTLTMAELDTLYRQVYLDQKAGKFDSELDYYEKLNRYRLCLQLQKFAAVGPGGTVHDLPDGLSRESNPTAEVTWQDGNPPPETGGTLLPMIEAHLTSDVLKREAVFRVVNTQCSQFNRLVAKLEAMADNSDFWRPTGEQS